MQAIILAAGKSNRFYPFTSVTHKSLVSLMGKTLIQRTLESLKKAGITNALIVVAKNSPIPSLIEEIKGLSITFVVQNETLGMGHALLCAKDYLEESFILLSAYHFDCSNFIHQLQKARNKKQDVVLLAKEDSILEQYGVLEIKRGKVKNIIEKPSEKIGKGIRIIGIYLLSKTFLTELEHIPTDHYHFEKALASYAQKGNVAYVKTNRPTITVKYAWDLLTVKDMLLGKIKPFVSKKAFVSPHAIISGSVHISDGVKIMEGVCIKGPCYVGENVIVGNNAILRNGVILEKNVVVGATMEIKNSILMANTTTHTGFIGDSVIGKDTKIAAGFLTANVRLDRKQVLSQVRREKANTHRTHMGVIAGENINFGVNIVIMPGILIGNNVTIGPSTVVMENIEDNSIFYTKFQTVMKKKNE